MQSNATNYTKYPKFGWFQFGRVTLLLNKNLWKHLLRHRKTLRLWHFAHSLAICNVRYHTRLEWSCHSFWLSPFRSAASVRFERAIRNAGEQLLFCAQVIRHRKILIIYLAYKFSKLESEREKSAGSTCNWLKHTIRIHSGRTDAAMVLQWTFQW